MAKLSKIKKRKFDGGGVTPTPLPNTSAVTNAGQAGQITGAVAPFVDAGLNLIDANRKNPDRASLGLEAAKGATKGAMLGANPALIAATGGLSILAGAAIGGGISALTAKKQQKEYDKQQELETKQLADSRTLRDNNAQANLQMQVANSGYSQYGNSKVFKNGGTLAKTYTNGGTLNQLNSDTIQAEGNTHEQGGIDLSQNAEIENGETVKDNGNTMMVMSNSIKNPLSGKTFAKDDATYAKKLSKFEDKDIASNLSRNQIKLITLKREKLEQLQQLMNGNSQGQV